MKFSNADRILLAAIKKQNLPGWKAGKANKKTAKKQSQSNKRAISAINRKIENKVVQSVAATVGTRYGGQYLIPTQVDILGQDTTGAQLVIRPFSGMGNGSLQSQRSGSEVQMTSLTYKIKFEAEALLHNCMGCLIVLDRSPTAVQPSLSNGTVGGIILNGSSAYQYLRYQNMDTCAGPDARFKVLKHIKVKVQSTVAGADWPPFVLKSGTINGKYIIRYKATAGSIEPQNQQILFCFYSDSAIGPHPQVSLYTRLRYKDA